MSEAPAPGMSDAGVAFLKHWEGCVLTAYWDDGPGSVPTIGYGHTLTLTPADVGVKMIDPAEADRLLREEDLPRYAAAVAALVTVPLTTGQRDALISFAFNLGCAALANSTLRRKLNLGDYAGAALEFGRWTHGPRGEVMQGLANRRAAEAAMFAGVA